MSRHVTCDPKSAAASCVPEWHREAGVQVQAEVLDLDPERAGAARDGVAGASAAPGRVLVPVVPAEPGTPPRMAIRYPGAAFLAHLIAVDRRLPQTRPRGRTAPAD